MPIILILSSLALDTRTDRDWIGNRAARTPWSPCRARLGSQSCQPGAFFGRGVAPERRFGL